MLIPELGRRADTSKKKRLIIWFYIKDINSNGRYDDKQLLSIWRNIKDMYNNGRYREKLFYSSAVKPYAKKRMSFIKIVNS